MNILLLLAWHFFLISLIAFGGASATLPEMHRVLVDSLHLMNDAQFTQLFAISQAAPGPNVLFVALFGWQLAGFAGAVISMVCMCTPSTIIAVAVEHFGARYHEERWYIAICRGLAPITIGLLISTGYVLSRSNANVISILLSIVTVGILLRFRLNPLWLIAAGAGLGTLGWI